MHQRIVLRANPAGRGTSHPGWQHHCSSPKLHYTAENALCKTIKQVLSRRRSGRESQIDRAAAGSAHVRAVHPGCARMPTDLQQTMEGLAVLLTLDKYAPLAYTCVCKNVDIGAAMVIIETSVFARQVQALLTDEEYRELQAALIERPNAGAIMVGSGGLRKMRWGRPGKGKRGGLRVIYYWAVAQEQLLMLFVYPKSEQEDLTAQQLRILRQIVEEEYP